jgi:hypothetical protein
LRKTGLWKWTTVQTQGRLRIVCAKSAAAETTGTAAKSSRQDPEAAEVADSTRTGREPGYNDGRYGGGQGGGYGPRDRMPNGPRYGRGGGGGGQGGWRS